MFLVVIVLCAFLVGIGLGFALAYPVAYKDAWRDMVKHVQDNHIAHQKLYGTLLSLDGGQLILRFIREVKDQ